MTNAECGLILPRGSLIIALLLCGKRLMDERCVSLVALVALLSVYVQGESAMGTREVLAKVGVHSRVVRLIDDDIQGAIRQSFADLPQVAASTRLVLQVKREEWGGEFVDLRVDEEIAERDTAG